MTLKLPDRKPKSGIAQVIVGVVVTALLIVIGAVVIGYFQASVNTTALPTQASAAVNNTFTAVWNAWPLLTVIIIVLVSATIIGILVRSFGGAAS